MVDKRLFLGKVVLIVIYGVGIVGLAIPNLRPHFALLTPITLLLSAILLLYFQEDWNKSFLLFMLLTYVGGFIIEAIGVATGLVFGNYSYGRVLGVQLWETPLIIGINWLILIYSSGIIMSNVRTSKAIRATAGAGLMVILDLVIEPVAIKLDFWTWVGNEIPLLNYFSWFLVSFGLLWVFHSLPFKKGNKIAPFFYIVQLLFFAILILIL